MAWQIDRDYLESGADSNVGRASVKDASPEAKRYRFRLLDDDGEVYYGGWFTMEHGMGGDDEVEHPESTPYGLYNWGMWDSGTTSLEVKVADAIETGLSSRDYCYGEWRKNGPLSPSDWVSIFG